MSKQLSVSRFLDFSYFKNDLQGGFVSFLVAVPLCLGIALASGAPLFAGIIAGIVGGLVVGALSKSALSISGPEAGLILVVVSALESLGSFGALQVALCVAGVMQIVLGIARAGVISNFIPSAVIKGMLAAIGIILIMKQLPHLLGYDADAAETLALFPKTGSTITALLETAVHHIQPTGLGIAVLALAVLVLWEQAFIKQHPVLSKVPGALIVVVLGVVVNQLVQAFNPALALRGTHLVQLPVVTSAADFRNLFTLPDFSQLTNGKVYLAALSIALVASLEALLSIEATDELDPLKRKTPTNWELKAQGAGNLVSGLIGGLPLTSVIVRSSVSLNAGARTKLAALLHGTFLLISVLLFPKLLNMVPWAALAAILLVTGYKLARVSVFKEQLQGGFTEFVPFIVTIVAILATDLLVGIGIGAAVGMFFILRESYRNAHFFEHHTVDGRDKIRISLGEHVSFLNKASILTILKNIPENATLEIDGTNSAFIDRDVLSAIENFRDSARQRNIQVVFLRKADDYTQNLAEQRQVNEQEAEFEAYYKLFDNDRNWVGEKLRHAQHPASALSTDAPKFLFIGCCDSRVPASEIIGTAPGEVFVHRNVANLVVSTDLNLMSVLEYAVEVLGVEHVVVCGHYGCGGVRVAMETQEPGMLTNWLSNVREVMQRNSLELEALETDEARYRRLVELNVIEQVYNLCQSSTVLRARQQQQPLHIHGWVYDSHAGRIQDLRVDTRRDFAEYDTVLRYHLRPEGLTRLTGTLHQPPAIYSIFAPNTGGPIIAIPPLRGDAPLGTP
ncbi:carbonic anhydrase [Hymenobacter taeanensis]|uniref:carbonic anhydrase n=1 Tax=Hymenobacter taeanensis TaxID=2735321 RepID=A0A6M6BCC4_9BACT|nr:MULTISPECIES: SulP family inorganic anion transporter [Hymenobacter]QJX45837.1 carbonic anhydrase [Hymenobacter taeanensis]UOQ79680.1 SulP family inorganic anion transporter [Hymenobacter sp. 5414T-23]